MSFPSCQSLGNSLDVTTEGLWTLMVATNPLGASWMVPPSSLYPCLIVFQKLNITTGCGKPAIILKSPKYVIKDFERGLSWIISVVANPMTKFLQDGGTGDFPGQWLRICFPMQWMWVRPGWTKIPCFRATSPKSLRRRFNTSFFF